MPAYQFNLVVGTECLGRDGSEFPNDEAALAEGAKVARELKSTELREDTYDLTMEIRDGRRVVARIPFTNID
jgi:hypothetical protein